MNFTEAEEKLRGVIRRRHLAYSTEDTYVLWLKRFARFVKERSLRPVFDLRGQVAFPGFTRGSQLLTTR